MEIRKIRRRLSSSLDNALLTHFTLLSVSTTAKKYKRIITHVNSNVLIIKPFAWWISRCCRRHNLLKLPNEGKTNVAQGVEKITRDVKCKYVVRGPNIWLKIKRIRSHFGSQKGWLCYFQYCRAVSYDTSGNNKKFNQIFCSSRNLGLANYESYMLSWKS